MHIKSIIPKILKREGIKKQIEASKVCSITGEIVKEIFFSLDIKVIFFKNGNIQIGCSNSVIANEVQLQRERIKNAVNNNFESDIVKNILVKII